MNLQLYGPQRLQFMRPVPRFPFNINTVPATALALVSFQNQSCKGDTRSSLINEVQERFGFSLPSIELAFDVLASRGVFSSVTFTCLESTPCEMHYTLNPRMDGDPRNYIIMNFLLDSIGGSSSDQFYQRFRTNDQCEPQVSRVLT